MTVRLFDVLRAAQGEVQDYRRISIDVEGELGWPSAGWDRWSTSWRN
ncbi:hypothetical protein [Streptosporangium sp. NBC_01756]|nr:hypothetical protein [Streptosporangium sp. NBC_01756]WSC87853.1 hypothetical protein OIE48_06475 [Streptosporangium sp. NBC_01756]